MTDNSETRAEAERLFSLLDDIDTLDDACRYDPTGKTAHAAADASYRNQARRIAAKRWEGPIKTDGYALRWKKE